MRIICRWQLTAVLVAIGTLTHAPLFQAMAADHDPALGVAVPAGSAPPSISSAQPFAMLMAQAMERMDRGMAAAPMTGDPDLDFMQMMIPHHQGAIDMAKVVLLYGKDPRVRNLAQGIIADQENEIRLMQSWLGEGDAGRPPLH